MRDRIAARLLRWLRVPPEPTVPEGASIRVFRAAPNYFRYRLFLWLLAQLGALLGLLFGLLILLQVQRVTQSPTLIATIEIAAWGSFLVQLPFSFLLLRLDFELRWYILSDRSLRIREGILTVREKTMTFANIQNIAVNRNPVQRLLGIADVQVRSAGGGGGGGKGGKRDGEGMHEAYFRGVENAEEIRGAIRERVRLHRDAGLGDPDDVAAPLGSGAPPALSAARELLAEVAALRRVMLPPQRS